MSRARAARNPELGVKVATTKVRYARVSARKMRSIVDLIRGLTVAQARHQLMTVHRPSAGTILNEAFKSVVANVSNNPDFDGEVESLVIGEIFADGGPMMKRFRPRAMGRACTIRKRTSHMTIKLYTQE